MRKIIYCIMLLLVSCQNFDKREINDAVHEWIGKEIIFLDSMDCIDNHVVSKAEVSKNGFKVVNYIDSMGCTPCRLNLTKWKEFIHDLNQVSIDSTLVLMIVSDSRFNVVYQISMWDKFTYPIYIDVADSLNRLNHFSSDERFQTLLLDKDNKVVAIGNPINNPKVKELYLKIIQGEKVAQEKETEVINTKVAIDKTSISLGRFNWQKEQKATFTLKNTGNKPLVVQDINTSCGCTSVSYSKEPVQPGRELELEVTYKAEHPEHFNKTITVYCNMESSPLVLKIMGDAE